MNELDVLEAARSDVPPMSARARYRGRTLLSAAMAATDPRPRRSRRRLATAVALGLTLTAGVTGAVVIGTPGGQQPAAAATILNQAAMALEAAPDPTPRNDQYVYQETRQLTTAQGPAFHIRSWTAADGSRPGRRDIVDESPTCGQTTPGTDRYTVTVGPDGKAQVLKQFQGGTAPTTNPCKDSLVIPVYDPNEGLESAPYSVLAKLPTNPDALLAALRADAGSILPTAGVSGPSVSLDVQTWWLIRTVAERLPSAQRAALFRAAAKLTGIAVYPDITDAAGRVGIGVGMTDPRLGQAVIVFDKTSYKYLGEVVFDQDNRVEFASALLRTGLVDEVGQIPS